MKKNNLDFRLTKKKKIDAYLVTILRVYIYEYCCVLT